MPVNMKDIETAITNALPVTHLEINDQSDGCGENYSIVVVSEVRVYGLSSFQLFMIAS
jgi:stress-induced morphogen